MFGLVSMAPVAAFTIYGFVSVESGGAIIPAYLLGAVAIMLTALSFAQMASVAAQAGSVYGYAKFAIGGSVGFLGGWAMLLDYILLGSLTAVYGTLYLASALTRVPEILFLMSFFAVLLWTGIRGVRLSTQFDIAVLLAQLGFCIVFIVVAVRMIGTDGVQSWASYDIFPASLTSAAIVGGASLTVVSFLGFDAISTRAEEVKGEHPGRRVGQATLLSVVAMLVVFILISWLLSILESGLSLPDPATSAFDILAARLPALTLPLAIICGLALGVGACQACHTGATRLVLAMARDGRLPILLSRVSAGFRTPIAAMLVTLTMIVLVSTIALENVDLLAALVSFGALTGFLVVNLSVLVHFGFRQRSRALLSHWIAPALGIVVVLKIMTGISPLALKLGLAWIVAGVFIYWLHGRGGERVQGRPAI